MSQPYDDRCNTAVATRWEVAARESRRAYRDPLGRAHHRMQVANAVSAVTRTVDEKVGWNRIAFAISLLIIGVAVFTLARLLCLVEIDKVVAALKALAPRTFVLAVLLV